MKNNPTPRIDAAGTHVQVPNPLTSMKSKPGESFPAAKSDAALPTQRREGFAAAWTRFWFTPTDVASLHALRVLGGLLFLFWLLPFAGSVEQLFSFQGLFDRKAYGDMSREIRRMPPDQRPHIGWSVLYLPLSGGDDHQQHLVGDEIGLVHALYWGAIAVIVLFTLGIAPRITGVLTYVLVVSLVSFLDAPLLGRTSEDGLLVILAFLLMIGYLLVGQFSRHLTRRQRIFGTWDSALPFLARLGKSADKGAQRAKPGVQMSYAANLVLRLFQINFALLVVISFLHKLQIGDWWSGVAFWYPLHPPFETKPAAFHTAAQHPMTLLFFYSLAQYLVLAWQVSFPVWAWRRTRLCRTLLIGGGVLGFIGCLWMYQLPAMGGFFLVGCLAFLSAEEWRWLAGKLEKFWQKDTFVALARGVENRTPVAVKA